MRKVNGRYTYADGGTIVPPAPTDDIPPVAETPPDAEQVIGTESSLSNWAGDYVTDMLGQGQALAELPYEAYGGPLTAGESELQSQAFEGIAGLILPEGYDEAAEQAGDIYDEAGTYDADSISTDLWNDEYAEQYMSPYIQEALDPQLAEIMRQNEIQSIADNASLTQAGAYGGSRQAIMNSESNDNMMRLMAEVLAEGYESAYDSAGQMFTSDMDRQLEADTAGAELGIQGLTTQLGATSLLNDTTNQQLQAERDIFGDQLEAGEVQRGIESEGVAADKAQFEEERDFPYQQVQYLHSLLGGMPLEAQNYSYSEPSTWTDMMGGASDMSGITSLLEDLFA